MHLAEPASILTGQNSNSTDCKDCILGLSAHLVHVATKQLIVLFQPLHKALGRYHARPLLLCMYLQAMCKLSEVQHYNTQSPEQVSLLSGGIGKASQDRAERLLLEAAQHGGRLTP